MVFIWILGGFVALMILAGFLGYEVALSRKRIEYMRRSMAKRADFQVKTEAILALEDWVAARQPVHVHIQSHDGLKLTGILLKQPEETKRWIIVVHGYTTNKEFMHYFGKQFYEQVGAHVLAVDLRGHGESEGAYVGMGWYDRLDLIRWVDWITEHDDGCSIAFYGISMGAATVLMSSGEKLPGAVKAIIADCGYTSVAEVFKYTLRTIYHIPSFLPVLPASAAWVRLLAGYNLYKASAVKQLKNNTRPLLLFHGDQDAIVPTTMAYPIKEAAGDYAELIIVPDAGHGESFLKDEMYWVRVKQFLEKTMTYS